MKIIIDTNVLISATFFGSIPRKVIQATVEEKIIACAVDAKAIYIITAKDFYERYLLSQP